MNLFGLVINSNPRQLINKQFNNSFAINEIRNFIGKDYYYYYYHVKNVAKATEKTRTFRKKKNVNGSRALLRHICGTHFK